MPDLPIHERPIAVAASRAMHEGMAARLEARTGRRCVYIGSKEALTADALDALNPEYVFFPHWSFLIPPSVFERHPCVIFHMTDLPFGRGGSPLQNLIARGIYETVVSALRCEAGLDAGPVYLKKPLSLHGNAEEIYLRAAAIIEEMIVEILETRPEPRPQQGEPTVFQRRKNADGNIQGLPGLRQVFDYIRMLDAEGYPQAFMEIGRFRFEFSRASLHPDSVVADVRITEK